MSATLNRRLVAEAVGTALLLAAVVGSGIMAERLPAMRQRNSCDIAVQMAGAGIA
jgi:glycerol uptake facilitator-like aquaporin